MLSEIWHLMHFQNQQTPNRLKTSEEMRPVRVYYKDGNSTMLIAKNVPLIQARSLANRIQRSLANAGSKLEGHFIYTKN